MGVDHGGGGEEAWLGDAPDADLASVAGDVFDEPIDGVVGVGAFVGVLRGFLDGLLRTGDGDIAFTHVAAADVLVDEDEFFAGEERRGTEVGGELVFTVGGAIVGRALHEDGIFFAFHDFFGNVDGGEEFDAVAHGDFVLVLGVVFADVLHGHFGGDSWDLGEEEDCAGEREEERPNPSRGHLDRLLGGGFRKRADANL